VHRGLGAQTSAARSSAAIPQSFNSSKKTLNAGSSNWMMSTPAASSSRASWLRIVANSHASFSRLP
jgi:hypothetical protein